jgi:hypothetical protein
LGIILECGNRSKTGMDIVTLHKFKSDWSLDLAVDTLTEIGTQSTYYVREFVSKLIPKRPKSQNGFFGSLGRLSRCQKHE